MWNIIQCAVQGKSHIKTEIPCQDKTYSEYINGVYAISLADGAGSAALSHFGAEEVTRFICSDMTQNFEVYYDNQDGVAVKNILINKLIKILENKSTELSSDISALASTLLFVAIKNNQFILGHIGDGVIGYLKNGELKVASHPENGEFANVTVFTTSQNAAKTMKLIKGDLTNITGFVLMSDGTETSLYSKATKQLAAVTKRMMELSYLALTESVQALVEQSFKNVISQQTTDDCSLIAISRPEKEFKGYNSLSDKEKAILLNLASNASNKIIKRYNCILNLLSEPISVANLAKQIHLKPKWTKKYIGNLMDLHYIEKKSSYYKTILKL